MQENNNVNNDYWRYYGITACAGIEWYFSKAMSLSAQYGIAYNYYEEVLNVSYAYNNVQQSSNEVRTTGFQIYPNSVLFGLTVYF